VRPENVQAKNPIENPITLIRRTKNIRLQKFLYTTYHRHSVGFIVRRTLSQY